MRRFFATLLIALTVLLPFGSVMGGMSPSADSHEMPCHDHGDQPQGEQAAGTSCPSGGHCCVAFLVPAQLFKAATVATAERILSVPHRISGFVPDHLDPPPVAL